MSNYIYEYNEPLSCGPKYKNDYKYTLYMLVYRKDDDTYCASIILHTKNKSYALQKIIDYIYQYSNTDSKLYLARAVIDTKKGKRVYDKHIGYVEYIPENKRKDC